jgi:large subunit ribosomal protein L27
MAHKKAGGTAKNLRDSNPKYLGVKVAQGQVAQAGSIIVRQRGTHFVTGANTQMGKDHTIFAVAAGKVHFSDKRKQNYDGSRSSVKKVDVLPA